MIKNACFDHSLFGDWTLSIFWSLGIGHWTFASSLACIPALLYSCRTLFPRTAGFSVGFTYKRLSQSYDRTETFIRTSTPTPDPAYG